MKFSRQKLQHLKWVRRKELIRINCFIMIAILLMVLLFMGFPIVSNAESVYTYEDTLPAHLGIDDTDILVPRNITQEEGYCYLMADDNKLVYFDDDLTNGAIIWDSSIDNFNYTVNINNEDITISVADSKCYRGYFTSNNAFVLEFYMFDINRYVTFQETSSNSSKLSMCYCGPFLKDENDVWSLPNLNYKITVSFSRDSSDNNFYIGSINGIRAVQAFTTNQRYIDGNYCYYGVYGQVYILGDIDAVALPTEPYLKRASYHEDANDNNSPWVTDWVNAVGVSYNPNYNSSGGASNLADIKDHLALYQNSVCYLVPTSMKNGNFYIYGNFDEEQKKYPDRYSVRINISCDYSCYKNVEATYICKADNGQNINNLYPINTTTTNFTAETVLSYNVSDFNNGKLVIPLSTINDSLRFSNTYPVTYMAQGFSNLGADNSLFVPFLQNISGSSVAGVKIDFSGVTNGSFETVLIGCNYHFDVFVSYKNPNNDTNTVVRGEEASLVYDYDFIAGSGNLNYSNLADDQKVKEATDSQTIPPAYNYDTNKPTYDNTLPSSNNNDNSSNSNSNSSDNITVSGGDNSINNIVNVNQGNKYPEKGVMQSFVRIINNDKNNTVNDIDTLIGGSSYIQLMNNALVAVPDQVWSIWITALKAILGIAVSAFFLKILINWAT